VFHCDIQPVHTLSDGKFEYLDRIHRLKPHLKLVTFHLATCCDEPLLYQNIFEPGGRIYTREEMLENAKENFLRIRRIFGDGVLIGVENNNYYPTKAYSTVTDGDFISEVVNQNGISFLFDLAHAKITSFYMRVSYESYRETLPLDRVVQVHIAKHGVNAAGDYYDAHDLPDADELGEVCELIRCYDVTYLTIEYYKESENLLRIIQKMRELIDEQ